MEPVDQVKIERLSFGGEGVGKLPGGKIVFVRGAFPGEVAKIEIHREKKSFARGEALEILSSETPRQSAPCPHASTCGGCQFHEVSYEKEWSWTSQSALGAFSRAARTRDLPPLEEVPAPSTTRYRRRLKLQVGHDGSTGFFQPGSHNLTAVEDCLVAHHTLIQARNELAPALVAFPGTLLLEMDQNETHAVALLQSHTSFPKTVRHFKHFWTQSQSTRKTLQGLRLLPPKAQPGDPRGVDLGNVTFTLVLDDISRTLEVGAFTQANPETNQRLMSLVHESLDPKPGDEILELYCGAGNFSLGIAAHGANLTGLEIGPTAIDAAKRASQNLPKEAPKPSFMVRNLQKGLPHKIKTKPFNKVLLDPPRAGAQGAIQDLIHTGAERIVYVSCDPPTMGRDVGKLLKNGYRLERLIALDMFPRTYHVEMMGVLVRT